MRTAPRPHKEKDYLCFPQHDGVIVENLLPIKYYMYSFSEENKDELGIYSSLYYTSSQIEIIVYTTNVQA